MTFTQRRNATCCFPRMMDARPRGLRRLLVIERGASAFVPDRSEGFDETVAIIQLQDERADDFADRAVRRIAKIRRSGDCLDAAALCVGPAHDPATGSARRLICLAITALADSELTLAELVVVTSSDASPELREQLLGLTDELVLGTEGRPLPVCIRFLERKQDVASQDAGSGEPRLAAGRPRKARPAERWTRPQFRLERLDRQLPSRQRPLR